MSVSPCSLALSLVVPEKDCISVSTFSIAVLNAWRRFIPLDTNPETPYYAHNDIVRFAFPVHLVDGRDRNASPVLYKQRHACTPHKAPRFPYIPW